MKKTVAALLFIAGIGSCAAADSNVTPISPTEIEISARNTMANLNNLLAALSAQNVQPSAEEAKWKCLAALNKQPPEVENAKRVCFEALAAQPPDSEAERRKRTEMLFKSIGSPNSNVEDALSKLSDEEEKEGDTRLNSQEQKFITDLRLLVKEAHRSALKCNPNPNANPPIDCKAPQQRVAVFDAVFGSKTAPPPAAAGSSTGTAKDTNPNANIQQDINDRKAKLAQAWTSADTSVKTTLSSDAAYVQKFSRMALEDAQAVSSSLYQSQTAANLLVNLELSSTQVDQKNLCNAPNDWSESHLANNSNDRQLAVICALSLEIAYNKALIDDKLQEIATFGNEVQAYQNVMPAPPSQSTGTTGNLQPNNNQDDKRVVPTPAQENEIGKEAKLLALLAKFPDTNFTGTNQAAKISASTAGSTASLTVGKEYSIFNFDDLASYTLSAPTSSTSSSATLYDHADGLANMLNVKMDNTFLHGVFNLPALGDTLQFNGLSAQLGYQQYQYYVLSNLGSEQSWNRWSGSLGAYSGIAWEDASGDSSSITLSASWQDTAKDRTSQTVCPLPTSKSTDISCVNGPINAPNETLGWLFSIGSRAYFAGSAIAPEVSYNTSTKIKEVNLPWYFIHSSDKATSAGYSGGLELGWNSNKHGYVGVFVGTPLPVIGGN